MRLEYPQSRNYLFETDPSGVSNTKKYSRTTHCKTVFFLIVNFLPLPIPSFTSVLELVTVEFLDFQAYELAPEFKGKMKILMDTRGPEIRTGTFEVYNSKKELKVGLQHVCDGWSRNM